VCIWSGLCTLRHHLQSDKFLEVVASSLQSTSNGETYGYENANDNSDGFNHSSMQVGHGIVGGRGVSSSGMLQKILSPAVVAVPSTYSISQSTRLPTLRIEVTSRADRPLTVFTFSSILNPRLVLLRDNFYCRELDDNGSYVWLNRSRGPSRPPFLRQTGHSDEQYFIELSANETVTVSCPLILADGWKNRDKHRGEISVHAGA
jgi:hypothetical protein